MQKYVKRGLLGTMLFVMFWVLVAIADESSFIGGAIVIDAFFIVCFLLLVIGEYGKDNGKYE